MVEVNGSWLAGQCRNPECGELQLVRTTQNVVHVINWRQWCNACRTYSLHWRWIRVKNAIVTDGNYPPSE